jgi:hypothetical protein
VALPEIVEVCRILLQSHLAGRDLWIVWCEDVDFVRKFGVLMRLGSSLGSLCEQIRINLKFFLILKNYMWLNLWLSMGNFSVCNEGNINQFHICSLECWQPSIDSHGFWKVEGLTNRTWCIFMLVMVMCSYMLTAHCRNYIWHALNRIVRCNLKQTSDWICIMVSWHMRCYPPPPKFNDCQTALYCTIIFFLRSRII